VTARTRRLWEVLGLSSGLGLVAVGIMLYVTWPDNTLGAYLHARRSREANIRALQSRVDSEQDPSTREYFRAWLAEEQGDFPQAIRGFRGLRDTLPVGTILHLHSSLRLGRAYGANGEPELELATYQSLRDRYPAASLLSQATFHLRRGDTQRAQVLLDEALAQDEKDGSLGNDRRLAEYLRGGLDSQRRDPPPSPR